MTSVSIDVTESSPYVMETSLDVTKSVIDVTNATNGVTADFGTPVINNTNAVDDVISFGDAAIDNSDDVTPGSDFHIIDDTIESVDLQSTHDGEIDDANEIPVNENGNTTDFNQDQDMVTKVRSL